jgi:hypothetical protein
LKRAAKVTRRGEATVISIAFADYQQKKMSRHD